jgi:hypothetical protein
MLLNCKPGCTGKKITTNGSLDLEQDEVICTICDEIIPVSKFTKMMMKNQKDILKKDSRKSFQYDCESCKKKVQVAVLDGKLFGMGCNKECKFNVSEFTIHAISSINSKANLKEDSPSNELEYSEDE